MYIENGQIVRDDPQSYTEGHPLWKNLESQSIERLKEEGGRYLLVALDEDELVFMHGISMQLLDLTEACGAEPPIELMEMENRLQAAVDQFYGEI